MVKLILLELVEPLSPGLCLDSNAGLGYPFVRKGMLKIGA
jgi:hypothetical protein